MNPSPLVIAAVFTTEPNSPIARLVHLALAALADESGHVETTVHTIEHLTGLLPIAIEAVLGNNAADVPLFPASVDLTDGVVVAHLLPTNLIPLKAGA
ncbi:hypothetical protein WDU99_01720 [Microbacterium sp. Mu-80]|uniref:Uncharacterized protein n=1 Tax=Microbacterium bandirmense TaxID=3122050 RepID=A0ABU8L7J7_9MICO